MVDEKRPSGPGRPVWLSLGQHVRNHSLSGGAAAHRSHAAAGLHRLFGHFALRLRRSAVLVAADDGRRAQVADGRTVQRGLRALQLPARSQHRQFFGRQIAGTRGALVALVGLLGPPFAIVTFFGFLYAYYGTLDFLQRMFGGVAAAAAGLTLSTSLKMLQPLLKERLGTPHLMALVAFAGVGVLRWPIYWVLGVLI